MSNAKKLALIEKANTPEYRSDHQRPDLWLNELIADARRLGSPSETIEVYEAMMRSLLGRVPS